MKQQTDLTVSVLETPGAVGKMKASQLARLIEGYIKVNPEITEPRKEKPMILSEARGGYKAVTQDTESPHHEGRGLSAK